MNLQASSLSEFFVAKLALVNVSLLIWQVRFFVALESVAVFEVLSADGAQMKLLLRLMFKFNVNCKAIFRDKASIAQIANPIARFCRVLTLVRHQTVPRGEHSSTGASNLWQTFVHFSRVIREKIHPREAFVANVTNVFEHVFVR